MLKETDPEKKEALEPAGEKLKPLVLNMFKM